MVDYGETDAGWRRKTFAEIVSETKGRVRLRVDERLTLDPKTPEGAIVEVTSGQFSEAWEVLEVARNGFDPDNAEGMLLIALAALIGESPEPARKGLVQCTLELSAGKSFDPGDLVCAVEGEEDNRWVNRDLVESTDEGEYTGIYFESEEAGAHAIALTGTLTVIAESKSGWISVTNPADAEPGRDEETLDELRARLPQSIARQGSGTVRAIRADVGAIEGVIECECYDNDTDAEVDGIPPYGIRVVIWDGELEDANDINVAQAILDAKDAGTPTVGAQSAIAVDDEGNEEIIYFDRATQVPVHLSATVEANDGASETTIKQKFIDAFPTRIAQRAVYSKLRGVPFQADGVEDVTDFQMSLSGPASGTSNIVPDFDEILTIDSDDIDVTIEGSS